MNFDNQLINWRDGELKSPFSGANLKRDTPHSLTDGATRFPVIGEIPYLRADRDEVRETVLRELDAGDEKSGVDRAFSRSG